jgi:hypothetical protein
MNINRKIQLTAAAVIVNGVLALGLLSAGPAFATTCNPRVGCIAVQCAYLTPAALAALCTYPGCTYASATCLNLNYPCDQQGDRTRVTCFYH